MPISSFGMPRVLSVILFVAWMSQARANAPNSAQGATWKDTAWDGPTLSPNPTSTINKNAPPISEWIKLDMSGRFTCHISGPQQENPDDGRPIIPILAIPSENDMHSPTTFVTGNYDFARTKTGITHLGLGALWKLGKSMTGVGRRQRELHVKIAGERDILEQNYNGKLTLGLLPRTGPVAEASTVSIQANTDGVARLSCSLPLNRRFSWQGNLLWSSKNASYPMPPTQNNPHWYVPNMKVNALGNVESSNTVWFRNAPRLGDTALGIRLSVRRALGFGPMGVIGSATDPNTTVRVDVSAASARAQNTARWDLELERPRSSSRLSIMQHAIVRQRSD